MDFRAQKMPLLNVFLDFHAHFPPRYTLDFYQCLTTSEKSKNFCYLKKKLEVKSKDVPHNFPFFYPSELPFSTGRVMISDKYLIVFFLTENQFGFCNFEEINVGNQRYWILLSAIKVNKNICESTILSLVLSFLLFIPFPCGKRNCLQATSRYKLGKVILQNTTSKTEMLTLAGNKHLSIHFFSYWTHPSHLSTQNGRT